VIASERRLDGVANSLLGGLVSPADLAAVDEDASRDLVSEQRRPIFGAVLAEDDVCGVLGADPAHALRFDSARLTEAVPEEVDRHAPRHRLEVVARLQEAWRRSTLLKGPPEKDLAAAFVDGAEADGLEEAGWQKPLRPG